MSEIVQVGGNNYTIPDQGDPPNWGTNLTPFFVALAAEVATAPAFYQGVAVASTPITVGTEQTYLVASNSITATLNLPAPVQNLWFAVKDSGKNCAVNNITIHRYGSESINGVAADKVLSLSGGFWMFGCDGTNWFMLRDVEALNPLKSTNQLVITPGNGSFTDTITFPAPAASRIYTVPDVSADCQFVMGAGAQTVAGTKTFSSAVIISAATGNTLAVNSSDLVVDSTNHRVAIGGITSAPTATLHARTDDTNDLRFYLHHNNATGDPYIQMDTNGQAWSIGSDNSDSDRFKISVGAALGTGDVLVIDPSTSRVGIGTSALSGNYTFRINGTNTLGLSIYSAAAASAAYFYLENDGGNYWSLSNGGTSGGNPNQLLIGYNGTPAIQCNSSGNINVIVGDFTVTRSSTGSIVTAVNNTSNTGSAHAQVQIVTAGSSAGDAKVVYSVDGLSAIFWALGVDNSDNDKFKLSASVALGTTDVMDVDPTTKITRFFTANTRTSFGIQFSLATNSVQDLTSYVVTGSINTITVMTQSETKWSLIAQCRMGGTPSIIKIGGGANADVSTAILSGTTGVAGNITLSSQATQIQLENRSGGTAQFYLHVISGG